ncbi:MAG: Asp-tRNA(Asn)/Glu-tRNA(Gln) amidotransferase subunit GatC [Flammeovirgaceae bacterium]
MKTAKSTIEYIAHLSRLDLEGNDEDKMQKDLDTILTWVEKLNEVDVDGVEPLYHMTENENTVRKDVANNSLSREKALKNAPQQDGEFFKVPKVLD